MGMFNCVLGSTFDFNVWDYNLETNEMDLQARIYQANSELKNVLLL